MVAGSLASDSKFTATFQLSAQHLMRYQTIENNIIAIVIVSSCWSVKFWSNCEQIRPDCRHLTGESSLLRLPFVRYCSLTTAASVGFLKIAVHVRLGLSATLVIGHKPSISPANLVALLMSAQLPHRKHPRQI